jgi:hypothetical protein
VNPVRVTDPGFEEVANAGRIKWAVTEQGDLVVVPKWQQGEEIAHSVLTRGAPVRAAGEAEVAIVGDHRVGIEITNYSGHYEPSAESLEIGQRAFAEAGYRFEIAKTWPFT